MADQDLAIGDRREGGGGGEAVFQKSFFGPSGLSLV